MPTSNLNREEVFELQQQQAQYAKNSKSQHPDAHKTWVKTSEVEFDTYNEDESDEGVSKPDVSDDDNNRKATKASIFHFARFPHDLIYLMPAYTAAMISGVAKPIQTIFLGKVFTSMGKLFSGEFKTKAEFMHEITIYSMTIVGLGCGLLVVNWLMLTCFDLFSASLLRRARRKMFVRFLNRDFAWYDTNKGIMGTLTTLNRCCGELQSATSMTLALISQAICTIIACLGVSFYYSWSVAFVSLAGLPLIMIVTAISSRFISLYFYNFKLIIEDASTLLNWAINSISTVKQFNGQFAITNKMAAKLDEASTFYFKFSVAAGLQQALSRFLILSMFVPVFVFGASLVRREKVNVGDVLTVFSCSFMISGSIAALGIRMEFVYKGQVACAKIKEFLDLGMSSHTYFKNMIGIFPETCEGSIVFKKVSISFIFD